MYKYIKKMVVWMMIPKIVSYVKILEWVAYMIIKFFCALVFNSFFSTLFFFCNPWDMNCIVSTFVVWLCMGSVQVCSSWSFSNTSICLPTSNNTNMRSKYFVYHMLWYCWANIILIAWIVVKVFILFAHHQLVHHTKVVGMLFYIF